MNFWKKSFDGVIRIEADTNTVLRVGGPMASLLQQMEGIIVEERQKKEQK